MSPESRRQLFNIVDDGDIILDVTFESSTPSLRRSRNDAADSQAKPIAKAAYRVSSNALKASSQYFTNLLSNQQFREAGVVGDAHRRLAAEGIDPSQADASRLPSVAIVDDDAATQTDGHEPIFRDMLLVLHRKPIQTEKVLLSYAVTLAVIADRFDCVAAVSRSVSSSLKFRWPVTISRPLVDERGRMTDVEQVLRQKVLVSWLLSQPLRLQQASRELIIRGSSLWGSFAEADGRGKRTAAWWNLPDGLERELEHRRECILNAIASVQRHFIGLYASRERQCKLGYGSSPACDAFQLGEMIKFLTGKGLLFLVDFGPASLDSVSDTSLLNLEELIDMLKQLPKYQVDSHHSNCGPQVHIKPILDYIRTMLSADVVSISQADWKRRRADVTWIAPRGGEDGGHQFAFTRNIASDQRLRHERSLHINQMAKSLFTADGWDWTPEA
ncbi:hypothetical protein CDD80_5025 [Ophiocordyceps camponoti-rufipedis]|uniref:Uncharacterized protein n=1 Tax=Ophiocordyceps camponoti-rufipedis TaxID=2004952 RepID=A0A2C5ZEA9_9HYPO|nr:hypothetical protein CDD80_5025 [Ophiocordyceps camponoti-rufipedis]